MRAAQLQVIGYVEQWRAEEEGRGAAGGITQLPTKDVWEMRVKRNSKLKVKEKSASVAAVGRP